MEQQESARAIRCPGCGGAASEPDRFCRACGYPLADDPGPKPSGRSPVMSPALKVVASSAWLAVALSVPLIAWVDVEAILITGPSLLLAAKGMMLLDARRRSVAFWLGMAHVGVVVGVFLMIFVSRLSPDQAMEPCLFIASIWTLASALPTWSVMRAKARVNPWVCGACGYPMIGIEATACPECGEPFRRPARADPSASSPPLATPAPGHDT